MRMRYEVSAYRKSNPDASRTVWRETESEVEEWCAELEVLYPDTYHIEITTLARVEEHMGLEGKRVGEWVHLDWALRVLDKKIGA